MASWILFRTPHKFFACVEKIGVDQIYQKRQWDEFAALAIREWSELTLYVSTDIVSFTTI
jgi:hypothetical protein